MGNLCNKTNPSKKNKPKTSLIKRDSSSEFVVLDEPELPKKTDNANKYAKRVVLATAPVLMNRAYKSSQPMQPKSIKDDEPEPEASKSVYQKVQNRRQQNRRAHMRLLSQGGLYTRSELTERAEKKKELALQQKKVLEKKQIEHSDVPWKLSVSQIQEMDLEDGDLVQPKVQSPVVTKKNDEPQPQAEVKEQSLTIDQILGQEIKAQIKAAENEQKTNARKEAIKKKQEEDELKEKKQEALNQITTDYLQGTTTSAVQAQQQREEDERKQREAVELKQHEAELQNQRKIEQEQQRKEENERKTQEDQQQKDTTQNEWTLQGTNERANTSEKSGDVSAKEERWNLEDHHGAQFNAVDDVEHSQEDQQKIDDAAHNAQKQEEEKEEIKVGDSVRFYDEEQEKYLIAEIQQVSDNYWYYPVGATKWYAAYELELMEDEDDDDDDGMETFQCFSLDKQDMKLRAFEGAFRAGLNAVSFSSKKAELKMIFCKSDDDDYLYNRVKGSNDVLGLINGYQGKLLKRNGRGQWDIDMDQTVSASQIVSINGQKGTSLMEKVPSLKSKRTIRQFKL